MDASIQVPHFGKEKGYDKWRFKFLLLLDLKNCREPIEHEEKPVLTKDNESKIAERKAKVLLSQAVDVELIMECPTAFAMMKKLDDNLYMKNLGGYNVP